MEIGEGINKFNKLSIEIDQMTDMIAKTNSRVFAIETMLRKLNTEEYLTNNYQIKNYIRVCQIAILNETVVERINEANITGETFRQLIEIVADSIRRKTTDEDIVNSLCVVIETEDNGDQ